MILYDDCKIGKALEPHFVETHAGKLHVYEDRTQAGDIVLYSGNQMVVFTTDKFKKYVPTEWIKSKIDAILDSYPDGNEETEILCKLLYEWEKENETN